MRWYLDIIAQVTLILYDAWYYTSPISEYCLLMINLNCDVLYIYYILEAINTPTNKIFSAVHV